LSDHGPEFPSTEDPAINAEPESEAASPQAVAEHGHGAGPDSGTGHRQVDEALAELARVADAPPAEQVGPLAAAHEVLRETLDAIGRADAVR
jgi:hypothetical protein